MNRLRLIRLYLIIGCSLSVFLMIIYYLIIGYKYLCGEQDIAIFREHYFSRWQDDAIIQQRQHPILIYQPKTMDLTIQSGFSVFHSCPTSNCIITSLESHIATADVIFFAENSEWMPPVIRNPAQIWIIRLLENPMNTVSLTAYNGMVNYTAGYRPDCNLLAPYGAYRNFSKNQNSSNEGTIQEGPTVREGIVWLVSNCFTGNNRLGYARALQKHYKVHIYGKCGGKYLPKKEEKITLQKYKYYLAFENQNCRHYITEKFWNNALGNNLIPIVMGPPKHDYQLVAPSGSFIHTDDFKSAEGLARYLLEIDENEKLYLSFFDWKKEGYLTDSNFYCRLCAFVQNPRPSTYSNIDTFWRTPKQCSIANYTKRLPVL